MVTIVLSILIGYFLGSIATGVWLGKALRNIDIREHGSKSTGATNVVRVLGWKLGVIALIIDIAKGFAACLIASRLNLGDISLNGNQLALIAGLAAVLGHLFPVFAGFKGGKGIATGAGVLLFLFPLELGFALLVFITTIIITRFVSLGSILAALFFSISIFAEKYILNMPVENEFIFLCAILIILVLYTHRANIKRLLSGIENKFGQKSG